MFEDAMQNWLRGSTPLAMPAAGAGAASSFFGNYNPYASSNTDSQRMDMLAQTQRFTGVPTYKQDQSFTPDMSPDVKALWDKRQAYNAMSPQDQQLARTTGNGYFNNADSYNLTDKTLGPGSMDFNMKANVNDWTGKFNDQMAMNRLAEDNGNMPSFAKQYADAQLNHHTFASAINSQSNVALPSGDQFGRVLHSQDNHGLAPNAALDQFAKTRDFFSDALLPNPQALQTQSGTHNGSGMGGLGSGMFQDFSAPQAPQGYKPGPSESLSGKPAQQMIDPNQPWGTPGAYQLGYHAPTQVKNNSLLAFNPGGASGVNFTGTGATAQPAFYEGPNGSSFSGYGKGTAEPANLPPDLSTLQQMQARNGGFGGPGGFSHFANPNASGTENTLNGMPANYYPEQGTGGLKGQNERSVYGGTPESHKNLNLNNDYLRQIGTPMPMMPPAEGQQQGGANLLWAKAKDALGGAVQWGNNTLVDAVNTPVGQYLTAPSTQKTFQELQSWNPTPSNLGLDAATSMFNHYNAPMYNTGYQAPWYEQLRSLQKY